MQEGKKNGKNLGLKKGQREGSGGRDVRKDRKRTDLSSPSFFLMQSPSSPHSLTNTIPSTNCCVREREREESKVCLPFLLSCFEKITLSLSPLLFRCGRTGGWGP